MRKMLNQLVTRTEAQDLIEYALIGAIISCCAIASVRGVGSNLNGIFSAGVATVESGAGTGAAGGTGSGGTGGGGQTGGVGTGSGGSGSGGSGSGGSGGGSGSGGNGNGGGNGSGKK